MYSEGFNMGAMLAADGRFLAIVPAHMFKFGAQHPSIKVLPIELPTTYRRERNRYAEEPDIEPAGGARQRLRAGDHEAAGEAPSTERPQIAKRMTSAMGLGRVKTSRRADALE